MARCADCKWLEADYVDGSDGSWSNRPYVVCRARGGVSNLKQFPFASTKCDIFHPNGE